jgi:hypothetical protein
MSPTVRDPPTRAILAQRNRRSAITKRTTRAAIENPILVDLSPYERLVRQTLGLIAYWRFNEQLDAVVATDATGSFDASLNGTFTLQSTGLLTTEANDGLTSVAPGVGEAGMSINVPGLPAFTGNDPFSFEGWIKPSISDSSFRRVLDQLGTGANGYALINASSVGFYFTRVIAGAQVHADTPLLSTGVTKHFVVTYDGTTIRIYLDGALSASATDARSMPANAETFRIGHFGTGLSGSGALYGVYDEFAVYNVALDAPTIADHYIVGSGLQPPPPPAAQVPETQRTGRTKYSKVALYAPLNESSGTTVAAQKRRLLFFEKDGYVNGEIEAGRPLDPDPNNWAGQLYQQAISPGTYFNIYSFSKPVYLAPHDVSHIKVTDTDGYLNQDNSPYKWGSGSLQPFNSGWRSADGEILESTYRDRHLIVVDPTTDKLWEYFHVIHSTSNPMHNYPNVQATHGGKADNLSSFSGTFPDPLGGSGTGISVLAGLIRMEEVQAGEIPHILAFATPRGTNFHVSPATRGDQPYTTGNRVPEGSIYQLDPALDVDAYCASTKASYLAKLMMRAAQKYGIVCMDGTGSSVTFFGEDQRDVVTGVQGGASWYPYLTSPDDHKACTGVAATNVITCNGHGFGNGVPVFFFNLTGGAGLSSSALTIPLDAPSYYTINSTTNTFQVSLTIGGAAVDFTTDISAGQVALVHQFWRLTRVQNFPWGNFDLLPAWDANAPHRTPNTWNDLTGVHSGAVTPGQPSLTLNTNSKSVLYAGGKTTFADDPMFDVGATCTIRALAKTTTVAAGEAIILHRDVYELKRSGSSLIGSVTIGAVVKSVTATSVFTANVMADVALTYDGSNVKLWKNGVQAGSSTAATGSVDTSAGDVVVGSLSDGTKAFAGQLQHVEVLQEALPVGRLLADYTAATT